MKLTTLFLLVGCLHLSAASYSQTITLGAKEYSLGEVFKSIEKQTDFKVVYNARFLEQKKPLSIKADQMALEEFLNEILEKQDLVYEIHEKTILIGRGKQQPTILRTPVAAKGLQARIVTGKVIDESNNPLEGVTVIVKGTSVAVTTDKGGNYRIQIPANGSTLVFTIVGFEPMERTSGVKTPFIVTWPKGINTAGTVCSSLLSAIDIAPTLLELAGISAPPNFQGLSFVKLFDDVRLRYRTVVFAEHNWHDYEAMERMVRTEDFLYIVNLRPHLSNQGPGDVVRSPSFSDLKESRDLGQLTAAQTDVFLTPRPKEELYDCNTDPEQLINLASVPRYASILERHRQVMTRWRQETADTTPEKLTGDWRSRETAEPLGVKRSRGTMPGTEKHALQTNGKGH